MKQRPWPFFKLLTGAFCLMATPFLSAKESVTLRPVLESDWAQQLNLPDQQIVTLKPEALPGFCDLLLRMDELSLRVNLRQRAHQQWMAIVREEEEIEMQGKARFELTWQGRSYRFDRYGRLMLDERFTDIEDAELISRFEAQYRELLARSAFGKAERAQPIAKPQAKVLSVPIFSGFEDDRYQKHDALILKLVTEFNANRAAWAGAEADAKIEIPELKPALIKAMMLEETGGNGKRSREAWEIDPLQVNVPGDWDDSKADLGLTRPKERNEGSLEANLRAGIQYLVRKGFGSSGKPIAHRSNVYFDSWRTALKRYNGRNDRLHDGRTYRNAYADRILRRAKRPDRFVPIAH